MSEFEIKLSDKTKYVEKIIYRFCPTNAEPQNVIIEAANYSIKAGGKRLRPLLMLETLKLFGGQEEEIYPFMAAIEMIHTYSLVHDDLPAMDNDMYRRGMKTTHAVYGEDIGILAGDGLLNYAYEIMSRAILTGRDSTRAAKAMSVIAEKSGMYGMVGGQTVDVINDGKEIPVETLNYIHKHKTAALIEASMMAGAIVAGTSETNINLIEKIANNIGIAFQIEDDILDVTSTMEVLGKPVLSDEKNKKCTYVTLMGIDRSRQIVKEYTDEALKMLNELSYKTETGSLGESMNAVPSMSLEKSGDFLRELIIKLSDREK